MASPGDRSSTFSGFTTEGNARVHAGHVYNNHTVNNYNPTRSDETLPGPDRYRAFSQAVVEGQVPRIRSFLRMNVDLDETGASGLTVLHRAVLSGHEDVVDILIEAGADVNAMSEDFGTPLCLAALKGAHEVVTLLVRRRARAHTTTTKLGTALHCCVIGANSCRATIDTLLATGAPVSAQATIDTRWLQAICEWDGSDQKPVRSPEEFDGCIFHDATPAYIAIRAMQSDLLNCLLPMDLESKFEITFLKATDRTNNSSELVRQVQKNRFDMTLPPPRHTYLSSSAMTCDIATIRLLIARGVSLQSDSDECDITALMVAAGQGSTEIVRLLLDKGAPFDTSSRARWTALHYAAASGNDHTVRMLWQRGASANCRDFEGRTPLLVAADYMPPGERYLPLNTLLSANADINTCDTEGLTPLHKILRKDHINTAAVEEFVKAGANTRLVTNDGTSVLKLCMTIPLPGPALMAIGRGLNYGITFMEIICDRLNYVREAYEDLNDREHMLVYLSAQAGYEHLAFLISLGCDVQVIDSDGSTALQSAVDDDDFVAIEALLKAGASLDAYTGDEATAPLATDDTARVQTDAASTTIRGGAQILGANTFSTSRTVPPRNMTESTSASVTMATEPQQRDLDGNNAIQLAEASTTAGCNTSTSSDPLLADLIIADSLVAESLFAESLVAEVSHDTVVHKVRSITAIAIPSQQTIVANDCIGTTGRSGEFVRARGPTVANARLDEAGSKR
ncbi:hypothetical protein MBLNU13_g02884t1 [Cladosporium sp. NU13]